MYKTLIRMINDMKLRTKLILSFIVVVFVPVLIVGLFLTNELREMAIGNAIDQAATNVDRVKKRTSEVVNVSYDIAYRLANDTRLETVASRRYESVYDVVKAYKEYPDFREYMKLYREIGNIRLYVDNPTLLDNWEFIQPTDAIRNAEWYQQATSSSLVDWVYIVDERDNVKYLSLVRRVDFPNQGKSGVLVINVNSRMLNQILNQESFDTMIVDSSNQIVSANRPGRLGRPLNELDFENLIKHEETGTFETVVNGSKSQVMIEELKPAASMNGLRVISIFAIDDIVGEANQTIRLAVTVISISLAVAIFLIYAFSILLAKRMLRLSKNINKVATGNLGIVMEIDGKDEIGQLSRQFNAMVSSINALVVEVQESNQQKRQLAQKQNEIKFKMMASQINPHFLFNALESIRMKAHMKGETEIAKVVRLLGKMMRKNLEVGNRSIPMRSEIDIVRCYLEIQKFRHGDRLHFELLIDPKVEETLLPPLIIQPIVENAVVHGLESKEEGGLVRIKAELVGQDVHVEVMDNGSGMTPERAESVKQSLLEQDDDERNRIGLRNVHMRLQLTYGQEHGLVIDSVPSEGTRIHFIIPFGGRSDV
ncbi:two-component system sensor histidine kinase YesM [Paenibacillus phyllosphaerae]|uniref:Two-component system sensor histidine kinase YesM n=1 Tax=Paenibacillus phyllosphaerae TaxID=274593 RepID=A0A7W5AWJ0_9BACL|nr:two-component system sensor histidine kinase YesM [Paenibacillus phyllosphaerae]